jgi:hypothetical protein
LCAKIIRFNGTMWLPYIKACIFVKLELTILYQNQFL